MTVLKETPRDETKDCRNCMNCMRRVSQVTRVAKITQLSLPSYDGLQGFGTPPPYGQHQADKLESHAEVFVFEAAIESHSGFGGWAEDFYLHEEHYDGPIALISPDGIMGTPPAQGLPVG